MSIDSIESGIGGVKPGVHDAESAVDGVEPGIDGVKPGVVSVKPGVVSVEAGVVSDLGRQHLLKLGVMSERFGLKVENRVTDLADVVFQAVDPGVCIGHVVTVIRAADSSSAS